MAAPELSDPGTSTEWFPTVQGTARTDATARRRRFQRLVTYAMLALAAFSVLGLASSAWRRRALKADLEALPAAMAQPPTPRSAVAAARLEAASPPTPPVFDAPVPAPAAAPVPPVPAVAAGPAPAPAPAKPRSVVAKKPSHRSPFLKSVKPQPAALKRR